MVKLASAGLVVEGEIAQRVFNYKRAGLGGNADAMIKLHKAGIPGTFAMAQSALMNGTWQTKTPEERVQHLIESYNKPIQQTSAIA